jgi:DNA-binding NtrC family response regulator
MGGTILIVDDEEDFLDIMNEALSHEGFSVLSAADGGQAVSIFQEHGGGIDLVILDIMMPGLDGAGVFEQLKSIRPDVKVVICSGFSVQGKATEMLRSGALAFIQKPYPYDDLFNVIYDVIEEKQETSEA